MRIAKFRDSLVPFNAPATINKYITLISVAITTARNEWGIYLPTIPTDRIKRMKEPEFSDVRLEPEEEAKLLEHSERSKKHWLRAIIIEKKEGDCSEHALLFTNLARAEGFPAREVGGWTYDGIGKFMPHAWVEVAIKLNNDFYWLPVDPTWNTINPINVIKGEEESLLGRFTLRVRKIRYANGETIVLLK